MRFFLLRIRQEYQVQGMFNVKIHKERFILVDFFLFPLPLFVAAGGSFLTVGSIPERLALRFWLLFRFLAAGGCPLSFDALLFTNRARTASKAPVMSLEPLELGVTEPTTLATSRSTLTIGKLSAILKL